MVAPDDHDPEGRRVWSSPPRSFAPRRPSRPCCFVTHVPAGPTPLPRPANAHAWSALHPVNHARISIPLPVFLLCAAAPVLIAHQSVNQAREFRDLFPRRHLSFSPPPDEGGAISFRAISSPSLLPILLCFLRRQHPPWEAGTSRSHRSHLHRGAACTAAVQLNGGTTAATTTTRWIWGLCEGPRGHLLGLHRGPGARPGLAQRGRVGRDARRRRRCLWQDPRLCSLFWLIQTTALMAKSTSRLKVVDDKGN